MGHSSELCFVMGVGWRKVPTAVGFNDETAFVNDTRNALVEHSWREPFFVEFLSEEGEVALMVKIEESPSCPSEAFAF